MPKVPKIGRSKPKENPTTKARKLESTKKKNKSNKGVVRCYSLKT
jgi:hypothetical protein